MTIEDRDRKILWARAHNSCAICKTTLILDGNQGDRESVVGDEAHIVARSKGGPRAGLISSGDLDKYDNLILLCKVHHKQVDDQPNTYSVEHLRRLKTDHERWADDKFGEPETGSSRIQVDDAASKSVRSARPPRAGTSQTTESDIVLTAYPVKKKFIVTGNGIDQSYDVPQGFEMLLIDLEHMFELALDGAGISVENVWWELGFDPADKVDEYSVRRLTFTARPGYVRPPHGIRQISSENGYNNTQAYRPDLDRPEWRGGITADPRELRTLIYFMNATMKHAVEDGYEFESPWMFRIIEDPKRGKCVESFCKATWTKPKRWRVSSK